MQAVILAGGRGTRLFPVLPDWPKPMAPVGDKFFLEIILDLLKKNGLSEFIFCVCHLADKIMDYFGDGSKYGVKISYNVEEQPLGTGGAIGLLRNVLNETFWVLNGDTYQELELQGCMAQHKASRAIGTMVLAKVADSTRYGQVITDSDGYVISFQEKGDHRPRGQINAGLYVWEPAVFDYIPPNRFVSLEKDVLPAILRDDQQISTYRYANNFIDIGIPADYAKFIQWKTGKTQGETIRP